MDVVNYPTSKYIIEETGQASEQTTLGNTDKIPLIVSGVLMWIDITHLKSSLKTYFDTLYQAK